MSLDDIGAAIFHMFLDWGLGSRYVVHVDRVSMDTHKFERSTIKGYAGVDSEYINCPHDENPDKIIPRIKEEYFRNSDRYIRPYSKNIRTFIVCTPNNINSYACLFYDRYENTVIGLSLEKIN